MALTKLQRDVLEAMQAGGHIRRQRTGFRTCQYYFIKADNGGGKEMPESSILTLVNRGLIKPTPKDALWDVVHYGITPAGEAELLRAIAEDMRSKQRGRAA